MRRVIYVIMDGVGVGALPDAADYGDEGSDTLGNTSRVVPLGLPFFQRLGLGDIVSIRGVAPTARPLGLVGRLAPRSVGKDSTVGHWEQMGLVTTKAFPTYPEGFAAEVMEPFIAAIGRPVLGNKTASGTEIIAELGDEHVATGFPIVYTSVDSVFQVAAHVDVVPLDRLYSWCEAARALLTGRHGVARVIARPFAGISGAYLRTPDRRDFSIAPPGPTYLDRLQEHGVEVLALGKISELFGGAGIDRSFKVASNDENLATLAALVREPAAGESASRLIITNLVDFDMGWGHRNDVEGFAEGLGAADDALARIAGSLGPEDTLLVTADHGVDPTTQGTDHSREYVPLLIYPWSTSAPQAVYDGDFADTGAYAFEHLTGLSADLEGISVAKLRPSRGWRRYTPTQSAASGTVASLAGRVGPDEAAEAARWMRDTLGAAPDVAIVLGSGLSLPEMPHFGAEVRYNRVPHWPQGQVAGHPYRLVTGRMGDVPCVVLCGRAHEYEGLDLSEVQLPIRSLSAWGVKKIALTSAAGGTGPRVQAGDIVVVQEVLDVQYRGVDGVPVSLAATSPELSALLCASSLCESVPLRRGAHASVPGPQYETPAEVAHLARLGACSVSMGPAAELRAARDEGLEIAVFSVVTNVGQTTHEQVLQLAAAAGAELSAVLSVLCARWL